MWLALPLITILLLCPSGAFANCWCNTTTVWDALKTLFEQTTGPTWIKKQNWIAPASSVCDWEGLSSCHNLSLSNNNLIGTLPAEFGNASMLTHVYLDGNKLSGTLPPELERMVNMTEFSVRKNALLSGPLPATYGAWSRLTYLDASSTQVNGSLPSSFANWESLRSIDITNTKVTGTLPTEFEAWRRLESFFITNTDIYGQLPDSYSSWTALTDFQATSCQLTGTLPPSYGAWRNLVSFRHEFNGMSNGVSGVLATLPESYGNWTKLRFFAITSGVVHGTLPASYAAWTELVEFLAGRNELTGTVPTTYDQWHKLQNFRVHGNLLTGTLSPSFSQWKQLSVLYIFKNQLFGPLPDSYSEWSLLLVFSAANNRFNWTLPSSYSLWSNVQMILLPYNRLVGTIPSTYAQLTNAKVLSLENNDLDTTDGPIPVITTWVLFLHNNRGLAGTILPSVNPLYVSVCNTSICGPPPRQWTATGSLTSVVCQDTNELYGEGIATMNSFLAALSTLTKRSATLPECPASTVAPAQVNSTRLNQTSLTLETTVTSALFLRLAAAMVSSGTVGVSSLQVSLFAVRMARRLSSCSAVLEEDAADSVGEFVADSPTRLTLGARLSMTSGTVVGNALLLVAVPAAVAAAVLGLIRAEVPFAERISVRRQSVDSALGMWGVLQVPTAAAAVSLLAAVEDDGDVVVLFVGAAGVVGVVVAPVVCVLWGFASRRKTWKGRHMPSADAFRDAPLTYMLHQRSKWSVPVTQRNAYVSLLLVAVLEGCHYPSAWVLLWDIVLPTLEGVLSGIGMAECSATAGALWALLLISAAAAVMCVAVRPRPAFVECVFEAVMACWTGCIVLQAIFDVDAGAEESAIAQAVLQLLWSAPLIALRCAQSLKRQRVSTRSSWIHTARKKTSRGSVIENDVASLWLTEIVAAQESQEVRLRELISMICNRTRVPVLN